MSSGIYKIENILTGKYYVGSSVDIKKRWNKHLSQLRKGTHPNKHLQSSYNKYGEDAFKFEVLEFALFPEDLVPMEQKYIDGLNPEYNLAPTAGSQLGVKRSEDTKKKMSEAKKGNKNALGKHLSEETRKKISEAESGKYVSEETKKKMSEALKGSNNPMWGKPRSEETKKKISEALEGKPTWIKGKHHTEETKRHISESHKGKPTWNKGKHLSEETKLKISESKKGSKHPMWGKHFSEETKRKMRESRKKYLEKQRKEKECKK